MELVIALLSTCTITAPLKQTFKVAVSVDYMLLDQKNQSKALGWSGSRETEFPGLFPPCFLFQTCLIQYAEGSVLIHEQEGARYSIARHISEERETHSLKRNCQHSTHSTVSVAYCHTHHLLHNTVEQTPVWGVQTAVRAVITDRCVSLFTCTTSKKTKQEHG